MLANDGNEDTSIVDIHCGYCEWITHFRRYQYVDQESELNICVLGFDFIYEWLNANW